MVGTVNLRRDNCKHWEFYAGWIPGKELAVWLPGSKWNATAKNRLSYAHRHGFIDYLANWEAWNLFRNDIFKINTSAKERQGNPMSDGYLEYPEEKHIENTCKHHRYELIMVRHENTVLAYAIVHIAGDLMNISTILGHADFLKDSIMLPLMSRIQQVAIEAGCKAITYYLWDSGTKGLQYHKHSVGFKSMQLAEIYD